MEQLKHQCLCPESFGRTVIAARHFYYLNVRRANYELNMSVSEFLGLGEGGSSFTESDR
jgi:hypothetical protein